MNDTSLDSVSKIVMGAGTAIMVQNSSDFKSLGMGVVLILVGILASYMKYKMRQ